VVWAGLVGALPRQLSGLALRKAHARERNEGRRQLDTPPAPEEHRAGPDAPHKTGHEQAWWESHGIDANTLADRLWRASGDTAAAIKIIMEAEGR